MSCYWFTPLWALTISACMLDGNFYIGPCWGNVVKTAYIFLQFCNKFQRLLWLYGLIVFVFSCIHWVEWPVLYKWNRDRVSQLKSGNPCVLVVQIFKILVPVIQKFRMVAAILVGNYYELVLNVHIILVIVCGCLRFCTQGRKNCNEGWKVELQLAPLPLQPNCACKDYCLRSII